MIYSTFLSVGLPDGGHACELNFSATELISLGHVLRSALREKRSVLLPQLKLQLCRYDE